MIKNHHLSYIPAWFLALVFSLMLGACSEGDHDSHDHEEETSNTEEHSDHEEIVRLTDDELAEFSIEISTAASGTIRQHRNLTGEIVVDPDRLAHITPRFPGIVKRVRKKVGDRVRAGEVLAIIESNESLAPYSVTSLTSGTVIEMHLTPGEVVNDENHEILVADLSYVWADLNAYQKDLEYLEVGQEATVAAGGNIPPFSGKISWISPTLSEARRTATARVIIANPNGHWRPGLFVNAEVVTSSIEVAVSVPKTALEMFEEQPVVFVKTEEGFKPQPVKTGKENHSSIEILDGLAPGDRYVSAGGFTLKAELEKSAFGDDHGH